MTITTFKVTDHAIDRYLERVGEDNRRAARIAIVEAASYAEELTGADWLRSAKPQDLTDTSIDHRIYRPLELVLVLQVDGRRATVLTVYRLRTFRGRTLKGTRRHVGKPWRKVSEARARRRELERLRILEIENESTA